MRTKEQIICLLMSFDILKFSLHSSGTTTSITRLLRHTLVLPGLSQDGIFSSLFDLSSAPVSAAVVTCRQNSQCSRMNLAGKNNCVCYQLPISFSFLIRLITCFTTISILAQETRPSTKTQTLPYLRRLIWRKFYPPCESEQKEVWEIAFTRCRTSFYP